MGVLKPFLTLFIFVALKLGRFWSNFFYERWEILNSESFGVQCWPLSMLLSFLINSIKVEYNLTILSIL